MDNSRRSFYITTLGCPKNTADSSAIHQSLLVEGLVPSESPESSDFHLINSCTFIQSATEETIQTILQAGEVKKQKDQKLIVVGCFSQRYPEAIREDMPEVDFLFGTGRYHEAGQILKEAFPLDFSDNKEFNRDLLERMKYDPSIENFSKPYSYVKISDGCNRGCAFCIIPSLRGKFVDVDEANIISQTKRALLSGAKEICLVSQDTIYYKKSELELANLLMKLNDMEGLEILRPLYLYPDKKTYRLLDYFSKITKLAPYLESPLQHVSTNVLKAMNRSGDYEFFKDLYNKARSVMPDLEIRTSFIMGFPSEKPEDVDLVMKFISEVKPEKVNLFPYSPQEGTKGLDLKGKPSDREIAKRVNMVRDLHLENLKDIHAQRLGKIYPAIVDEKAEDGIWVVRRYQDAPEIDEVVFVEDDNLKVGDIGHVRVDSFQEYDMTGSWVQK
ncbi:MiaB/RimO family radical SAM methylthiotransferase [Leptospira sp. GIMC2001]|uniref:MiaB/RimO family radical SAM methylthiotransferase n=1 Tax=Leptospira sp. GIMC2001 TaxID=1513297 RepID=UPI00234A499E|nr:MiaB/RimO family radical SAM methylthiotransferase [Leptospira sp. GIMC2001]WCL48395.1 MiaB/RimO family radical SAM methylthiotransferase [Leptospira sp. GIMC2001]